MSMPGVVDAKPLSTSLQKACICVPNVVFIEVPKTLGYTKAFAMLEASQLPKAKFARYFSKKGFGWNADSLPNFSVFLL